MPRTRNQVSYPQVKKEERGDKPKLEQLLCGTKNTSNSKNKITKKEKTATTKPTQAQIVKVKSENTDDSKEILALPMWTLRRSNVTAKKLTELIDYIVNDKMSVSTAARKARMSCSTAQRYYQEYQNDPEHKIPSPKAISNNLSLKVTQKKIEDLITYIVHEKMSLAQATYKVNLSTHTANLYYTKYMEDPDRRMPVLDINIDRLHKRYTQKQIKELIGYIVDNGMTIVAASKKAKINIASARRYYLKYLRDPNHKIPVPGNNNTAGGKRCTNDQVKRLIGCIVDDGMGMLEASVIVNMCGTTARKYYKQYLEDPNHEIPTANRDSLYNSPTSLDQLKVFFHSMIVDKSNVKQASLKARISENKGQRFYSIYLNNPTTMEKSTDMYYSVEKMKKMVEYIQNDKMTIKLAALKVNLGYNTARKYYHRYLKNPENGIPIASNNQYTQEDIRKLIGYIEHCSMDLKSAARRLNMSKTTAYKYYHQYQKDPEHKILGSGVFRHTQKRKAFEIYSQIIADSYKNNPSIKSIGESYSPYDSSQPDVSIKLELLDEDMKMILKDEE